MSKRFLITVLLAPGVWCMSVKGWLLATLWAAPSFSDEDLLTPLVLLAATMHTVAILNLVGSATNPRPAPHSSTTDKCWVD